MDDIPIQKISPQLAALLSAAAGWALSGDVGSKPGHMTHSQQLEWERAVNQTKDMDTEKDIFKSLPSCFSITSFQDSIPGDMFEICIKFTKISFFKVRDFTFCNFLPFNMGTYTKTDTKMVRGAHLIVVKNSNFTHKTRSVSKE